MPPTLTFRLLTKCRTSTRRGIGFLEGHGELNAGAIFQAFTGTVEREFRSSMDQWLDGAHGPSTRFHNFKSDKDHRNCFVFKHKQHRLYGFLGHPKHGDKGFQLCALCIYARKNEFASDRAELDRVEQWYRNIGAHQAITLIYPPPPQRGTTWKN